MKYTTSRREMIKISLGGFLAMIGFKHEHPISSKAVGIKELRLLEKVELDRKVKIFQDIYERVAFSDNGIMYSMQRLDEAGIRPFVPEDFDGAYTLEIKIDQHHLDGPQDYLHGENSIFTSGIYMAAQSYRYLATGSKDALRQARKAFRSMDLIYQMGEADGKPGWMGKPYGFKPSLQTSPDQYLGACWGLFTYHKIAEGDDKKRIEQMLISFADYWKSIDYVLSYFGSHWDMKGEVDSYNAVMVMMNALAYHFSNDETYLNEARILMARGTWMTRTRITGLREQSERLIQETGEPQVLHYSALFSLVKDILKPGEFLCWETIIQSEFTLVAADIIAQTAPELLEEDMSDITTMWWKEWKYGMESDYLSYYWFAVDPIKETWRPLKKTALGPPEQWAFGDPFCGYISEIRWNEPLSRFMVASAMTCKYSPENRDAAKDVALNFMNSIDAKHLLWMYDPDGAQLVPQIEYYGKGLSSEVPSSFLATYWMGRYHKFW